MERKANGTLIRMVLLIERESQIQGVNIEAETQRIIEKLKEKTHVAENQE